ncbi:hypothetical protein [Flavobacterium sp. LAR06]|uniref:hypothetical protein n=1 Tax=Flavobacterium sp. LAR06 TaxID=3064897 RepID=UPI0035BF63A5
MKFKVLFLILFAQSLFAQDKPIVFVNNSKAYYNAKTDFDFVNEPTFSEITINPNSTFFFYSRPHVSCFTWREVKGKWKKEKNIYTFINQYEIIENDIKFTFKRDPAEKYVLKFKTDRKSELKNRIIKIQYLYNFDDKIDDFEKLINLNQEDLIIIPFSEIPNLGKLASIRIEYQLNGNEKRYGYITENKVINIRENSIPNNIEIEFIEFPKKEIVYRTTKANVNNGNLQIISSEKTKIKMIDYSDEIGFEKNYKLEK